MTIMSVAKFERFFRSAASLEVDKADLKRYSSAWLMARTLRRSSPPWSAV